MWGSGSLAWQSNLEHWEWAQTRTLQLEEKTWQKQRGSDALVWNGNEESNYSTLCIESKKNKKVLLFCFNPTEVNERIRTRFRVSLSFKIFLETVSRGKTSFGDWRMLSFVEQLIKASYNLNDLLWDSRAKQRTHFLQDRGTLIGRMWCVLYALHSDMGAQC